MGISYQSTLSLIQVLAQQSVLRTRSGIGTVSHDGIVQFLASNVQLILVLADTQWVIDEARSADHREMVGDTMPVMERALEM